MTNEQSLLSGLRKLSAQEPWGKEFFEWLASIRNNRDSDVYQLYYGSYCEFMTKRTAMPMDWHSFKSLFSELVRIGACCVRSQARKARIKWNFKPKSIASATLHKEPSAAILERFEVEKDGEGELSQLGIVASTILSCSPNPNSSEAQSINLSKKMYQVIFSFGQNKTLKIEWPNAITEAEKEEIIKRIRELKANE